jgi:hypothetical protein
MRPIKLYEVKRLKPNQRVYHRRNKNANGSPQWWAVYGRPEIWKQDPDRVRVTLRRCQNEYYVIEQWVGAGEYINNFEEFSLESTFNGDRVSHLCSPSFYQK